MNVVCRYTEYRIKCRGLNLRGKKSAPQGIHIRTSTASYCSNSSSTWDMTYLHGLHGQGDAKDNSGEDVEDAGKDERRAQVDVPLGREGDHQGKQGA